MTNTEIFSCTQAFNQEQHALVMSSLQPGSSGPNRRLDGIDNPALDLGGLHATSFSSANNTTVSHNPSSNPVTYSTANSSTPSGKMAGYSFSDSSASQSLSLSSSNTDSLDTVIYKG